MSFVEWTNNLSIRVPEMDQQHQQLVAMLNEYHDAAKAGKGHEALNVLMNRLVDYTKTHLNNEERFLESIDYAFINSHKTEHRRLTEQVLELKIQFDSGDLSSGPKLLEPVARLAGEPHPQGRSHVRRLLSETSCRAFKRQGDCLNRQPKEAARRAVHSYCDGPSFCIRITGISILGGLLK